MKYDTNQDEINTNSEQNKSVLHEQFGYTFDEFQPANEVYTHCDKREPNNSYELVNCFDEVLNALNGIPVDMPGVLEVNNKYLSMFVLLERI